MVEHIGSFNLKKRSSYSKVCSSLFDHSFRSKGKKHSLTETVKDCDKNKDLNYPSSTPLKRKELHGSQNSATEHSDDNKSLNYNVNCQFLFRKESHASQEVWSGPDSSSIPCYPLDDLKEDIFGVDTGPNGGIIPIDEILTCDEDTFTDYSASLKARPDNYKPHTFWNVRSRKAVGRCISLYEKNPINGKISGDPIADAYLVCARHNNALLALADGVNWGEDSRLAAISALTGCFHHITWALFPRESVLPRSLPHTRAAIELILESFSAAQSTIVSQTSGLTTLCVALVLPIKDSRQFAVCTVNLGDSLAFLMSKFHGVREITIGSHDVSSARNIRDAGGALGMVTEDGGPELNNLTCSLTLCDPGDVLYLTSDGVSDNFDAIVMKLALPQSMDDGLMFADDDGSEEDCSAYTKSSTQEDCLDVKACCLNFTQQLEMNPVERQQYAIKQMEKVWHEKEMKLGAVPSAVDWCEALIDSVYETTKERRNILQDPSLYRGRKRTPEELQRDHYLVHEHLKKTPGKLDHATVVSYEIGHYRGNEFEVYEETS